METGTKLYLLPEIQVPVVGDLETLGPVSRTTSPTLDTLLPFHVPRMYPWCRPGFWFVSPSYVTG